MHRGLLLAVLSLALVVQAAAAAPQTGCYTPQEAAAHAGQYACVSGEVTRVFWARESNGRPTFVDLGRTFTIVIWEEDRDRFQPPPESWRGMTLTVWGQIRLYEGRAEIILRSPAQFAPPAMPQQTPRSAPQATAPPSLPPTAPPPPPARAAPLVPASPPPATPPPPPSPTPSPSPEPSPDPATPTPAPFPAAPGPVAPQARVVLTTPPAVLEGPVDDPPLPRPADDRGGPPLMLIGGALALLVLGLGGSILVGRKR